MTSIEPLPLADATEGPLPAEDTDSAFVKAGCALQLPAIVFCRSRKRVEGVARELRRHPRMGPRGRLSRRADQGERRTIEERFFHTEDAVLAATTSQRMGGDKSNIRGRNRDDPLSVSVGNGGRDAGPAGAG